MFLVKFQVFIAVYFCLWHKRRPETSCFSIYYLYLIHKKTGLAVHDAIAVKKGDAEWDKEAMERVRGDETLGRRRD